MLLNLSGIVEKAEFRTNNSTTSNKATAHTHIGRVCMCSTTYSTAVYNIYAGRY